MDSLLLAYIPTPYKIRGLHMKPLSLGHCLFFNFEGLLASTLQEGSIIEDIENMTILDFNYCNLVCSMTYEENLLFWKDPEAAQSEIKRWNEATEKVDFAEAFELFTKYLLEGLTVPAYEVSGQPGENGKGKQSGSHWLQRMKVELCQTFNYSESEFLNAYLPKLWHDWFSLMEARGAVHVYNSEELEELRWLKEESEKCPN